MSHLEQIHGGVTDFWTIYVILYCDSDGEVHISGSGNRLYNYKNDERGDKSRSNANSASLSLWSSIRHSRYWSGERLWSTLQYGRKDKIVAFNTQLSSGLIIRSVSNRSNGQTCCISSQIIVKPSSLINMFIKIKEWLDLYTSW